MSAKKVNKAAFELLIIVSSLFLLLLAAINIDNYYAPKKVLGVETKVNSDEKFWQDFLIKNPNYVQGWIEIGKVDRAKQIDPNHFQNSQ
jgi:hypothetical protein